MDAGTSDQFDYVDNETWLADVCNNWPDDQAVCLDTEFIRTNTFYPKVGLIQIANADRAYLIDPLTISQWDALRNLLLRPAMPVVIHSCSEDLNLLQVFLSLIPGAIFDTQRAAAYLGYGLSFSYQALVAAELDRQLGKEETRSDWLARPLSKEQLSYAAQDVLYLPALHQQLLEKLQRSQRLAWFEDDCRQMLVSVKDENSREEWEAYYLNIGGAWRLTADELLQLQKLSFWREKTARERNRPRSWILKDPELLELSRAAAHAPLTLEAFKRNTALASPYLERDFHSATEFLHSGFEPELEADPAAFPKPLSAAGRKLLKQCQAQVSKLGEELQLAPELLARKRQLVDLLNARIQGVPDPWPQELSGWRRQLLEPRLASLL